MKKGRYVISRDSIYIGTIIKTNRKNIILDQNTGKLRVNSFEEIRNILFTPDSRGFAKDLLYSSPDYPILNMTSSNFLDSTNEIVTLIHETYNLDKLLSYLGYYMYLEYKDIVEIRKNIFGGNFTRQNPELFGWNEIKFENLEFYRNGVKITDPKEIEARKWAIMINRRKNDLFQTFIRYNNQLREFEEVINAKSDNSLGDVLLGRKFKIDTFAPSKEEGKIKKLGSLI